MIKLLIGFALGLVARPLAYGFTRWYWRHEDNSSDLQPKRPEYTPPVIKSEGWRTAGGERMIDTRPWSPTHTPVTAGGGLPKVYEGWSIPPETPPYRPQRYIREAWPEYDR